MRTRIAAILLAVVLAISGLATAQERFGGLSGSVTDTSGGAMPGVTVVLTNGESGAIRSTVTNAEGRYNLADLVPGRYTVRFELTGFKTAELKDISVQLGKSFTIDQKLDVGNVSELVTVEAVAPVIDKKNTLVSFNLPAEEFNLLPKGRSFQSTVLLAPSVNQGEVEGGIQVNGASGAENSFTVDGVVTNGLVNGQSRQNTVFEYLDEVQVKTSGISAEFGGALGGVVSAVTKSGGNTFRGEAHYYYEGTAIAASPVKRLVLDPIGDSTAFYVQDKQQPNHRNEFGGSLGGPIVKDHLYFYGSYSPRVADATRSYSFTDGTGDLNRTIWTQQAFGKVTYAGKRMTANGSLLWTPTKADGTLSSFDGVTPNSILRTKASLAPNQTRGYEINQVNTSGNVNLTLTNNSLLSVRGDYFHDRYSDTGISQTTSWTYQTPAVNSGTLSVPASVVGPSQLSNTPRAQITGFDTTKRTTLNADYSHSFNAGGLHSFKGGFGYQHTENDVNSYYPGGYVFLFWDRSFTFGGQNLGRGQYGYYEVNDRRITGKVGANILSLYAQDQWTIGNRLTVNAGIRAEKEQVPTFRPEVQKYAFDFGFADKLAPRLGAAYDVFGDGRMKAFGSWGRYYDWTKYELSRGSFGAEQWCIYYRGLDTTDLNSLSLTNTPGRDLWVNQGSCRDRRVVSSFDSIDPDIEPMSQDSISGGVEYALGKKGMLSVRYIHNNLRETIEDIGYMTSTGDEGYLIGNPGKRDTAIQFPYTATPLGQPTPRPVRKYDALEVGFNRRLANNWFFSANYTLSRLYGNYSGLAASDEVTTPTTGVSSSAAQQQAGSIARPGGNVNRYWDLDEILYDSRGNLDPKGRLATDRPHVVKLYGSYQLPFGTSVGAFFYGASGTPVTTYVTTTNGADVFVYGRGDMGRTPILTRTDLLASHEFKAVGHSKLRVELNVTNLFNQKTARHIFNYVNRGAGTDRGSALIDLSHTDLTKGYDVNKLIAATPDGEKSRDPRFKMADLFEDGTNAYVVVKFLF